MKYSDIAEIWKGEILAMIQRGIPASTAKRIANQNMKVNLDSNIILNKKSEPIGGSWGARRYMIIFVANYRWNRRIHAIVAKVLGIGKN